MRYIYKHKSSTEHAAEHDLGTCSDSSVVPWIPESEHRMLCQLKYVRPIKRRTMWFEAFFDTTLTVAITGRHASTTINSPTNPHR